MRGRIPTEESGQVGNLYTKVQALFQDAVRNGYDHHAIADALMHGARDVLADTEFWTVFDRFKALRFP